MGFRKGDTGSVGTLGVRKEVPMVVLKEGILSQGDRRKSYWVFTLPYSC